MYLLHISAVLHVLHAGLRIAFKDVGHQALACTLG